MHMKQQNMLVLKYMLLIIFNIFSYTCPNPNSHDYNDNPDAKDGLIDYYDEDIDNDHNDQVMSSKINISSRSSHHYISKTVPNRTLKIRLSMQKLNKSLRLKANHVSNVLSQHSANNKSMINDRSSRSDDKSSVDINEASVDDEELSTKNPDHVVKSIPLKDKICQKLWNS